MVIFGQAGTAGVAAAIDDASLPDIAGCIAGDDVVVVCATDAEAASPGGGLSCRACAVGICPSRASRISGHRAQHGAAT